MEMSHPLPRPGAFAVFELKKKNRRHFVRTSPVDRVVLRLRIVTIADGADVPSWEDVVDERRIAEAAFWSGDMSADVGRLTARISRTRRAGCTMIRAHAEAAAAHVLSGSCCARAGACGATSSTGARSSRMLEGIAALTDCTLELRARGRRQRAQDRRTGRVGLRFRPDARDRSAAAAVRRGGRCEAGCVRERGGGGCGAGRRERGEGGAGTAAGAGKPQQEPEPEPEQEPEPEPNPNRNPSRRPESDAERRRPIPIPSPTAMIRLFSPLRSAARARAPRAACAS